jgi:hypothetical protein
MCKIIIIEEDMKRRSLYAEELKREGNQVIAVHRGKQAFGSAWLYDHRSGRHKSPAL